MMRVSLVAIAVMVSACASQTVAVRRTPLDEWRGHLDAGKAAHKGGNQQTAEREFKAALDAASYEKPPGLATAVSRNALSVLYINAGRLDEAARMLEEATRIFEDRGETDDEFFAMLLTNRAQLAFSQGRLVDAERESRRALTIGAVPKAVHDRAVRGLVASLCEQGRTEEAQRAGTELSLGCGDGGASGTPQGGFSNSTAPPDAGGGAVRGDRKGRGSAAAGER